MNIASKGVALARNKLLGIAEPYMPARRYVSNKNVIFGNKANSLIKAFIENRNACLISRLGTTEAAITRFYLEHPTKPFPAHLSKNLSMLSGFFPSDDSKALTKFCEMYRKNIFEVDIMGVRAEYNEKCFWDDEDYLLNECNQNCHFINIPTLDAFSVKEPWSLSLEGKRVLVIHPYERSIKQQHKRLSLLFQDRKIMPDFELSTIKAVQSLSENKGSCGYDSFFSALENMKEQIMKREFDIALIGAGAYGLPLGAYCKEIGKKAIHVGGCLQVFFGIKGSRWKDDKNVRKHINQYWVTPSDEERPKGYECVENSCYW